jgi:hypothetical protein
MYSPRIDANGPAAGLAAINSETPSLRQRRFQPLRRSGLGARMRRYPALGKGRISEALAVEHRMTKSNLSLRAAPALRRIR